MLADDGAIDVAELFLAFRVFALVGHVPVQPHQMLRLCTGFGKNLHDVLQRLLDLRDKAVADQFALCSPSDLARDKYLAAFGGDTVGVTFRWRSNPVG